MHAHTYIDTHTHTHTHTHRGTHTNKHSDHTKLKYTHLKAGSKHPGDLQWINSDICTEQKTYGTSPTILGKENTHTHTHTHTHSHTHTHTHKQTHTHTHTHSPLLTLIFKVSISLLTLVNSPLTLSSSLRWEV